MRVLYFTDTYPPQVNGVSVVTQLSVRGLRARGWAVGVVGPRYPAHQQDVFAGAGEDLLLALPSVAMPRYPEIRLVAPLLGRAHTVAERFRPDLVHCATEFTAGWVGQRVARRLGVPVVTSYHTDFGRYLHAWGVPRLQPPVTRMLTWFHQRAARTLTPSAVTRGELADRGLARAMVWGVGVDAERFAPSRATAAWRARLGGDAGFVFLHVGRLAPEKSVDRVLEAFARCRAELGEGVRLTIAGDGPSRPALERTAPEGVSFIGYLDRRQDLPGLYAAADAFVFASETETLGLVVLEAMASGLPVVAAPAGGVADHLRHGVNGLAYPAGDVEAMAATLIDLATSPALHSSLSLGARETAERLSWEAELDRLDACYREVIGGLAPLPHPRRTGGRGTRRGRIGFME